MNDSIHLLRCLGFVHQYFRQASRFQHVSTIHELFFWWNHEPLWTIPWIHYESHVFFLRLLQAAASGVDIIRGRHFGDSLLGSFAEMRFEPPSREEVHSTCGTHTHISFESRTCTGWNLVRILKYLEISLRDSSVNCTILHRDWSLLVLCPCARFILVYPPVI